jgi:hypothetical protein
MYRLFMTIYLHVVLMHYRAIWAVTETFFKALFLA